MRKKCVSCNGEGWINESIRTIPCPECGGEKTVPAPKLDGLNANYIIEDDLK